MTGPGDVLAASEPVRLRLQERHRAREVGLAASRDAIRAAANAIRAVHRGDDDTAERLLTDAAGDLDRAVNACEGHPTVLHAGFVADAAKEVAEAVLSRAAIAGDPLPDADAAGVDDVAWLHGLAETVGELRRAALDRLRRADLAGAERCLALMEDILTALATIDVPDGLTRGLRRAADAARAITERTRGDVTVAAGQEQLRRALDAHRATVEGGVPGS